MAQHRIALVTAFVSLNILVDIFVDKCFRETVVETLIDKIVVAAVQAAHIVVVVEGCIAVGHNCIPCSVEIGYILYVLVAVDNRIGRHIAVDWVVWHIEDFFVQPFVVNLLGAVQTRHF